SPGCWYGRTSSTLHAWSCARRAASRSLSIWRRAWRGGFSASGGGGGPPRPRGRGGGPPAPQTGAAGPPPAATSAGARRGATRPGGEGGGGEGRRAGGEGGRGDTGYRPQRRKRRRGSGRVRCRAPADVAASGADGRGGASALQRGWGGMAHLRGGAAAARED